MSISVYQIYFDKMSEQRIDPAFIKYINDKKDGYFENTVIKDIYDKNVEADYIGITSWKQHSKTQLTGTEIISHIEEDIRQGKAKDIYLYPPVSKIQIIDGIVPMEYAGNGIIKAPHVWDRHKAWGKGQPYKDVMLLNNAKILPFDLLDGKWMFCDCNYWIARKPVFNEYCENILLPVINFFERPEIKKQMPEWYAHPHENKKYNSASFILEGLFGAFLAHSNYSYSYICKRKFGRKLKKVNIVDYKITRV